MTSRSAEYSIQGFVYEFTKCLNTILSSKSDESIMVNGIIEDIDVNTPSGLVAIQCKYHESIGKFTLSDVYKPVLLMMDQYATNPLDKVEYILFAHFPGESIGPKTLKKEDLEKILKTKDAKLSNIAQRCISKKVNIDKFLTKFKFQIGESLEELQDKTIKLLETEGGFSNADVKELFYPNSIQFISELAIKKTQNDRKTTKEVLLSKLKSNKKTAISRWTLELKTYEQLLKARRSQLSEYLEHNSRLRYLIFSSDGLEDFDDGIVNLIEDFVRKYNSKVKLHDQTPIFSFDCTQSDLYELMKRIHKKGLSFESGLIGDYFDPVHFIRDPERKFTKGWVEFQGRICIFDMQTTTLFNSHKPDDLFIIGDLDFTAIDIQDLNVEQLNVNSINELKYLLSLTKTINPK